MASARFQNIENDIEESISCPYCKSPFKDPRFLPCGHTSCLPCIEKGGKAMICTICNQRFTFDNPKEDFIKNTLIQHLVCLKARTEIIEKLRQNPFCDSENHGASIKAFGYCVTCDLRMCSDCKIFHDRIVQIYEHLFIPAEGEDGDNDSTSTKTSIYCDIHKKEIISHWCLDCKIPSCQKCCPSDHNMEEMSMASAKAEKNLLMMKTEMEDLYVLVQSQTEEVNSAKKRLKTLGQLEVKREMNIVSLTKLKLVTLSVQLVYICREIRVLLCKGNEVHKSSSLAFIIRQRRYIKDFIEKLPKVADSDSTSSASHSFSADDVSSGISYTSVTEFGPTTESYMSKRTDMAAFTSNYENEENYQDAYSIKRHEEDENVKHDITEKKFQFDTETRITGMTLFDGIIIVASNSASRCIGFDLWGNRIWDLTEKLTGPYDVTALKGNKQRLFITNPGRLSDCCTGTVFVFEQRKNKRYSYLKQFVKKCVQPRGITYYSGRIYICESWEKVVLEYEVLRDNTGHLLQKYGKGNDLRDPIYITVHATDKLRLLVSDSERGLKIMAKGEMASNTLGWAVTPEQKFTPSKSCVSKHHQIFIGNMTGRRIHSINFQTRRMNHEDFELDEQCGSPVVLLFDDVGHLYVACKDGTIAVFNTIDTDEENQEDFDVICQRPESPLYENLDSSIEITHL